MMQSCDPHINLLNGEDWEQNRLTSWPFAQIEKNFTIVIIRTLVTWAGQRDDKTSASINPAPNTEHNISMLPVEMGW